MFLSAGIALAFTVFSDIPGALAAIGPSTTLTISNANIAPDGFTRSYAWLHNSGIFANKQDRAVVTNGIFPGPLLTGQKVSLCNYFFADLQADAEIQGNDFKIDVKNQLKDNTMELTTSIVSVPTTNSMLAYRSLVALARSLSKGYEL